MKICSLGSGWFKQKAGVEHAIQSRHSILNKCNYQNNILFTTDNIESLDESFISMIEYYQGSKRTLDEMIKIDFSSYNCLDKKDKKIYLDNDGNKIFEVIEDEFNINVFQFSSKIIIKNIYTKRGYQKQVYDKFIIYFDENSQIKVIYDIEQNIYQLIEDKKIIRLTFEEIVAKFLNEFLDKNDVLIFDRTDLLESLPSKINKNIYKILAIHNNHIASNNKDDRLMNGFYTYMLNNNQMFDLILTATKQQSKDINERFNCKCKSIPVGYVDNKIIKQSLDIKEEDRFKHLAVMFTRIDFYKQIHLVIDAYAYVIKKYPDATLSIYGFSNKDENGRELGLEAVNKAIEKHSIQDNVLILPYINDKDKITAIEQKASLYLLGSSAEGFNLGLMEGLGCGLIGVSTNTNYGPNELISFKDNVVDYNDFETLSNRIMNIYDNEDKMHQMRIDSLKHIEKNYSEKALIKKWKSLINSIKKEQSK